MKQNSNGYLFFMVAILLGGSVFMTGCQPNQNTSERSTTQSETAADFPQGETAALNPVDGGAASGAIPLPSELNRSDESQANNLLTLEGETPPPSQAVDAPVVPLPQTIATEIEVSLPELPGLPDSSVSSAPAAPAASSVSAVSPDLSASAQTAPGFAPVSGNATESLTPNAPVSQSNNSPQKNPTTSTAAPKAANPVANPVANPTANPVANPTANPAPVYTINETAEEKFARLLTQAQSLSRRQNLSQAEKAYRELVDLYPRRWEAWHGLARLYEEAGEAKMAEYFYKESLKLHGKNAVVYNDYGWFLLTNNRVADAYDNLASAVQYDPSNPCYLNNLGACMCFQNRPDSAVELFVKANGGDRCEAWFNVASIAWNRGDVKTTAMYLDKVLLERPTHSGAKKLFEELKKYALQKKAQIEQAQRAQQAAQAQQDAQQNAAASEPTPTYQPQVVPTRVQPTSIRPQKIGPNK